MRPTLRVVEVEPIVCLPWRFGWVWPGEKVGGICTFCRRDVASPVATRKAPQACIYCALDRALIPAIDEPLDGSQPLPDTQKNR